MKLDENTFTQKAMADVDELLPGDTPPELRLLVTHAWIKGFQSGFHAGMDESKEIAGKVIEQLAEALVGGLKGGEKSDRPSGESEATP